MEQAVGCEGAGHIPCSLTVMGATPEWASEVTCTRSHCSPHSSQPEEGTVTQHTHTGSHAVSGRAASR